ncbi:MAG: transglycosylase SLT domain-containing protein [Bacteroidales bacterium]|nr:transglycosylase SLT domain-containing protein [Bacteroidales bacterium]
MKYSLILLLFAFTLVSNNGYCTSVSEPDSVTVTEEMDYSNFSENLESLMNLWFVQTSLANDTTLLVGDYENDSLPSQYPDSVIINRLDRLPTVIPLSYNKIVKNYINVYTVKKKDKLETMLGLSDYYFPFIEEILDYYDLPIELKYMAVIESALNPRAVSRVGATGMWQFMYRTGRAYGLTINSLVDERRDPIKATHSAARYLKDMYNIYHDWTLVIAAYNCGPGNVNKAIRRSGGKRNYWDIYYYLPRETRGYVPAFIAAAYSMNYYSKYNLKPRPIQIPLSTDTLLVRDDLHLKQVSEVLGIPIQQIRDLNPQYKKDIVPGKSRPFSLMIPVQYTTDFIDYQDSIYAYKDSIFFNSDNAIVNPTKSTYVASAPSGKVKLYYTVKSGDNLGYIAEWYKVGLSNLRYWNGIRRSTIRVGQKLVVYVSPSKAEQYKKINSMSFAEKQRSIGKNISASAQTTTSKSTKTTSNQDGNYVYYKVRNGDSVWEIAKKFPGVSDSDILKLNKLSSRDRIHPGQQIKIKPR